MKKFWGYVSNNKYSVGCTGQTVYLYDEDGNELAKFKDIIYGYTPMISPDGTLFVVKSADGRPAVYSLETLSFIKKFRFSKVDGVQDDGFGLIAPSGICPPDVLRCQSKPLPDHWMCHMPECCIL